MSPGGAGPGGHADGHRRVTDRAADTTSDLADVLDLVKTPSTSQVLTVPPGDRTAMAAAKVRCLDLFCGGGGSSAGARRAGAEIAAGVDLWPLATQTFQLNFPTAKTYTTSLTELSPFKVLDDVGRTDLLLASPECTHHSVAKGAKPRDEASKQLAFEVLRFVRVLEPRWLVLENVIQMQWWPSFGDWHASLMELGYHTRVLTLDAHHFGVPQRRRRLFVIADNRREPGMPRLYHRPDADAASILLMGNDECGLWPLRPLKSEGRAKATLARARRAIQAVGDKQPFLPLPRGCY